jgi:hypothetical protein
MYKLYRDQTECDSDDWGPPRSVHPDLASAMAATGIPAEEWETDRFCPDEVFTRDSLGQPDWTILAPAVAAELNGC